MRTPVHQLSVHYDAKPGVARGAQNPTRSCCMPLRAWSNRRREEIPSRRCAGPARVLRCWHRSSRTSGTWSVRGRWDACSTNRATACRAIARRLKASRTRIAMPSSSINLSVKRFQQRGQPVISVDTKKKELVGAFKNGGREWQPKGEPEEVKVHDFLEPDLGKAIPYGVYDLSAVS